MNIYLREIDESNWKKCIFLTTNKEGKHFINEEFVASNAVSLAQAKAEKGWIAKAIYAEDTMVGFTMYGYCYAENFYELCRLMIDYKYQGKGYGKAAILKVIEEMKKIKIVMKFSYLLTRKIKSERSFMKALDLKIQGKSLKGNYFIV